MRTVTALLAMAAALGLSACAYDDYGYGPDYGNARGYGYGMGAGQPYGDGSYYNDYNSYPGAMNRSGGDRYGDYVYDGRDYGYDRGGYYDDDRYGDDRYDGDWDDDDDYGRAGMAGLDPWLAETPEGQRIIAIARSSPYGGMGADQINIWFRRYADTNHDMRLTDPEIRMALIEASRARMPGRY